MIRLSHKQGATFVYDGVVRTSAGVLVDLTGYTITSTFRDPYGTSEGAATITIADQGTDTGEFSLEVSAATTAAWPTETVVLFDVRFASPSSRVDYTETIEVKVLERQTTS